MFISFRNWIFSSEWKKHVWIIILWDVYWESILTTFTLLGNWSTHECDILFVPCTYMYFDHWKLLPLLQTLSDWMSSALSKRHRQEPSSQQLSDRPPPSLVTSLSYPVPPASQKRSKTIQRMKSCEDVGRSSGSSHSSSKSLVTPLTAGECSVFSLVLTMYSSNYSSTLI